MRPTDTQAAVVHAFEAANSLTNAFETIKAQVNDPVMIRGRLISAAENRKLHENKKGRRTWT